MKLIELTPDHFFENERLKPSQHLYFIVAYLAKAWLVLVGATFIRGSATESIIDSLYSEKFVYFFHLAIGFLALIIAFIIASKSEKVAGGKGLYLLKFSLASIPFLLLVDLYPVWHYIDLGFRPNYYYSTGFICLNLFLVYSLFSPREKMFRKQFEKVNGITSE